MQPPKEKIEHIVMGRLGKAYEQALKRIAAKATARDYISTHRAIADARKWADDYASEMALYELKLLLFEFPDGARPEQLADYIKKRDDLHRDAKALRYWSEKKGRKQ